MTLITKGSFSYYFSLKSLSVLILYFLIEAISHSENLGLCFLEGGDLLCMVSFNIIAFCLSLLQDSRRISEAFRRGTFGITLLDD